MKQSIILGGGLSGLGVARSLWRAGIRSTIVCAPGDFATFSRGISTAVHVEDNNQAIGDYLQSVDSQHYLIPCSDDWVNLLSQISSTGNIRAKTLIPQPETAGKFTKKDRFAAVLEELTIPHPKTIILERSAASDLLTQLLVQKRSANYFIKPVDSQAFFRVFNCKAIPLDSENALGLAESALNQGLTLVAQEYIYGDPVKTIFIDGCCDPNGTIVAAFGRRRLRIYPEKFGNSTFMESIPLSPLKEQLDHLSRLFAETKYSGLFSAEWKADQQGIYRLLEINIRAWWYIEFATRCGLNLPLILLDLIDQKQRYAKASSSVSFLDPTTAQNYQIGKLFFHPYYDFHALKQQSTHPLTSWLYQLCGTGNSHFLFSDPLPAVAATINYFRGRKQKRE